MEDNTNLSQPCGNGLLAYQVVLDIEKYLYSGELSKISESHISLCERCLSIYEKFQQYRAFQCPHHQIISHDTDLAAALLREVFLPPQKYAEHFRDCKECDEHFKKVHSTFRAFRGEDGNAKLREAIDKLKAIRDKYKT